jgi:phosphoenolpyruvate-protein kinase (PTS system EI component)
LFDENDRAVLSLIADVIAEAHRANKPIGICGQAPSDFPEFARWLVEQGITSISLNPDVAIKTKLVIAAEENLQSGVLPLQSDVTKLTTDESLASQQSSASQYATAQTG